MLFSKQFSLQAAEDFARFYDTAHLSLFRYVMVLCAGNQAEAEDITAEAFIRAWEKRQQFSGSAPAALGWVITIARNLLIDRRRSEGTHPVEAALDETLADAAVGQSSIEAILIHDDQLQQALAAIQGLTLPQREIITLRFVLGWRVKAIASHLGLAENTVSVDLRRALAKLQAQLAPQEITARRTV